MDRRLLAEKTHNVATRLHPSDPLYKQWIFRYTFLELEKDIGEHGDITTETLFPDYVEIDSFVVSNSSGVLAGIQEANYFLVGSDPAFKPRIGKLSADFLKKDGDKIAPGDVILRLKGSVQDVLKVERILLNLLQRMSGIATVTERYVDLLRRLNCPSLLVPTRKTVWGLLDKRAVVVGGGGTHRLDLSDAVMIKDNHSAILNHDIPYMIKTCANNPGRFLEIEVESKERALEAAKTFKKLHVPGGLDVPGVIMFDNMKASSIRESIAAIREAGYESDMLLYEASGGIRLDNIEHYAKADVDIISVGEITHSAVSLDFSMDIKVQN
ncbi:MAG: carboxylating nicotinate-nucleotide diphosphorylase [Candidatus Gracilibacteria bacterium]